MRPCLARCLAVALLALGGCVIEIDGTLHHDRLVQAVTAASSEVALHQSLMSGVQSLDGARTELARHEDAMGERIRDLRLRLWDMSCSGYQADQMSSTIDQIASRDDDYQADMSAIGDLQGMRATCAQYSGELQGLLGRFRDQLDRSGCY